MEKRSIIIVVLLILTSFLVLSLHIIESVGDNGTSDALWFGVLVPLAFMYDLVLYSILGLIVIVIILILLDKKEGGLKIG